MRRLLRRLLWLLLVRRHPISLLQQMDLRC